MPVGSEYNPDWILEMGEYAHLFSFVAYEFMGRKPEGAIGIAVSGGSDSMALLHIFAQAAPRVGINLRAATVDHGLRDGAVAEAAEVGRVCEGLGISHEILHWQHGTVQGNLQEQAARARYRLLAQWAVRDGVSEVMIGHTADDQAENFLMGLSRAAGLDGLSGMRRSWTQSGVRFRRPLLHFPRAELRGYLTSRGVGWAEDPSNDSDRFARIKARRVLSAMKPLGITVDRLVTTIENLAEAQAGLVAATHEAWCRIGREDAGALHVARRDLWLAGPEITRRLLIDAIKYLSGADYAPRAGKIFNLMLAIDQHRDATLGGVRFRLKDKQLTICREPRAVAALECATDQLWDNRWQLTGPHAPDLTIRALGAAGLSLCRDWRSVGIPRDVLLVTPAIWHNQTLIAAPLAGFSKDWCAICSASFASFVLSH